MEETYQVGRPLCGQIMGFKFGYYNNSDARVNTPPQLYWCAALMIKHNIINIDDLIPHLGPNDEDIEKEYEDYANDLAIKSKTAGKFNSTGVYLAFCH